MDVLTLLSTAVWLVAVVLVLVPLADRCLMSSLQTVCCTAACIWNVSVLGPLLGEIVRDFSLSFSLRFFQAVKDILDELDGGATDVEEAPLS